MFTFPTQWVAFVVLDLLNREILHRTLKICVIISNAQGAKLKLDFFFVRFPTKLRFHKIVDCQLLTVAQCVSPYKKATQGTKKEKQ